MTDIVERLRTDDEGCGTRMGEAADEIERLRNELADLRKAQGEPVATAWMNKGKMVNAFPFPPNPDYNRDGYWTNKGYTQEPLYTSAPSIPEGWQLVPVKPTERMLNSAFHRIESEGINTTRWLRESIYEAMLSTAPSLD